MSRTAAFQEASTQQAVLGKTIALLGNPTSTHALISSTLRGTFDLVEQRGYALIGDQS
jgi:hypothetical protein